MLHCEYHIVYFYDIVGTLSPWGHGHVVVGIIPRVCLWVQAFKVISPAVQRRYVCVCVSDSHKGNES